MSVVLQVKPIKPKDLRVDAIRLELLNELRKQGRAIAKDLRACVSTWNDKPKFKEPNISLAAAGPGTASVFVEPSGSSAAVQHFEWVDKGTRDHWVPRTGIRTMTFRAYKAKSKIRVIGSSSGGRYGPKITRRGRWKVRGIKARNFTQTVQARRMGPFEAGMREATARGAAKAY